jgi:hypothetical protein
MRLNTASVTAARNPRVVHRRPRHEKPFENESTFATVQVATAINAFNCVSGKFGHRRFDTDNSILGSATWASHQSRPWHCRNMQAQCDVVMSAFGSIAAVPVARSKPSHRGQSLFRALSKP